MWGSSSLTLSDIKKPREFVDLKTFTKAQSIQRTQRMRRAFEKLLSSKERKEIDEDEKYQNLKALKSFAELQEVYERRGQGRVEREGTLGKLLGKGMYGTVRKVEGFESVVLKQNNSPDQSEFYEIVKEVLIMEAITRNEKRLSIHFPVFYYARVTQRRVLRFFMEYIPGINPVEFIVSHPIKETLQIFCQQLLLLDEMYRKWGFTNSDMMAPNTTIQRSNGLNPYYVVGPQGKTVTVKSKYILRNYDLSFCTFKSPYEHWKGNLVKEFGQHPYHPSVIMSVMRFFESLLQQFLAFEDEIEKTPSFQQSVAVINLILTLWNPEMFPKINLTRPPAKPYKHPRSLPKELFDLKPYYQHMKRFQGDYYPFADLYLDVMPYDILLALTEWISMPFLNISE